MHGVNMAEVVLFHHAQGLTPGVNAFAGELRRAGHAVHVPDLFEGRTFDTVEEGVSYAGELGFGEVIERGVRAAGGCPQSWCTPDSRSVCSRPRGWRRRGREREGHCFSTLASRCRSSAPRGPTGCQCRCMR